jgi:thioredoxin-related protein
MSTIAATVTLSAGVSKQELTKYLKRFIIKNPSVQVQNVEILDVIKLPEHPGWEAYLTNMKLKVRDKEITAPQIVFVNGSLFSPMLVDVKRNINYSRDLKPKMPVSFYNDAHLLYGNKDAKHKIVVFSDPQCPFCMEVVPEIMKAAREHPDTFALYYYHLPLVRIHPVSEILVRVMHVAQQQGKKDVVEKLYSLKIDPREKNVDKVLEAVKKHTGFVVSKADIEKPEVKKAVKEDEDAAARMMVSGTPTVYLDGVWDKGREKFKSYLPK